MTERPAPTLKQAVAVWAKIGILSFGGPAGQIALMHRVLVDEQRWIAEDRAGRPEFERLMTNTNPHPLGRFRAIGAPSNIPEFAAAFSCGAGDPMVRAQRCVIW